MKGKILLIKNIKKGLPFIDLSLYNSKVKYRRERDSR